MHREHLCAHTRTSRTAAGLPGLGPLMSSWDPMPVAHECVRQRALCSRPGSCVWATPHS